MAKGSIGVSQAFGYLLADELIFLKHLINSLPPNSTCINIGAGSGTSGLAFLESGQVGKLYTIDIFQGTRPEGGLGNELVAMKESGFEGDPRYHQICGDSSEIGKDYFKIGSTIESIEDVYVDMVFVDGDHSYEHCYSDIVSWVWHIKPGGIIALHDYQKGVWPGVERAVGELLIPLFQKIGQASTLIAFRIKDIY